MDWKNIVILHGWQSKLVRWEKFVRKLRPDFKVYLPVLPGFGKNKLKRAWFLSDYVDWLKIGGTLASIFGESGRSMYHSISRFYPHYTPDETDAQYSACIRNKPGYGSGMIFSIAKKYGILLKNN